MYNKRENKYLCNFNLKICIFSIFTEGVRAFFFLLRIDIFYGKFFAINAPTNFIFNGASLP